jgi:hypothetical protein
MERLTSSAATCSAAISSATSSGAAGTSYLHVSPVCIVKWQRTSTIPAASSWETRSGRSDRRMKHTTSTVSAVCVNERSKLKELDELTCTAAAT